jgi:PKD repeat protein
MSIDSVNFVNQLRYYYLFEWTVREVCLGATATNITANTIPAQADITGSQVSVSATDAIWQFNGNGSLGATSYSWDFGDGSTGTGATPTHAYTANGQYTVVLTIQTQCGPRSNTFQITVQGISVEENGLANMSVYPNPTRDQVVITFESGQSQDVRIELINALGQTIWTESVQNHSGAYRKELSLGSYAKGIYHLRIHTAKGTHTERISLQ